MRGLSFKLVLLNLLIIIVSPIGSFIFRYELFYVNPKSSTTQFVSNFLHPLTYTAYVICNTIILLRITTDLNRSTAIGRLLSQRWWTIINKLTYCVYLIHYEVLIYMYTVIDQHRVTSWYKLFQDTVLAWIITFSLSLPLYLLYESPLNRLIGMCLGKK